MKSDKTKQLILLFIAVVVIGCVVVMNSTDVIIQQNKKHEPDIDLSIFNRQIKQDTLQIDSLKNK